MEHMEERTPTLQLLDSPLQRIKIQLTQTCMFRGAKIDASTLSLYSKRLFKEPIEDVIAALEKIQEMPRKEGELGLPEIGIILAAVASQGFTRRARDANASMTQLVRWKCPECGVFSSGFISPADHDLRRCQGIPKDKRTDCNRNGTRICGAILDVVHRGY